MSAVAVVGADGFVGSSLCDGLRGSGHSVFGVTRTEVMHWSTGEAVPLVLKRESESLASIVAQTTATIWAAGSSTPSSTSTDPVGEIDLNLIPLCELLSSPAIRGKVLLFVSTGGALYGDIPQGRAEEATSVAPRSYYAACKAAAEHFVRAACTANALTARILRPSNIYGPGQAIRPGFGVIPTALSAIHRGTALDVMGGGKTVRDFLYVSDFVDLCQRVLTEATGTRVLGNFGVFNASTAIGVSLDELIATIERVTGRRMLRQDAERRNVDFLRVVLDNAAAMDAFGWQPAVSLDEGIQRTWDWFESSIR